MVGPLETLQALRSPPPPALLIVSTHHIQDLTPERLTRIRRAGPVGLRRLPVLALTAGSADTAAWSAAGAFTLPANTAKTAVLKLVRHALAGGIRWVESAAYVGPCRRTHKALFRRSARRLEDSPMLLAKPKSRKPGELDTFAVTAASVDAGQPLLTVLRRLRISNYGVGLQDRDQRARFLADVRVARAQASRSTNYALVKELAALESQIEAAGASGALDPAEIDTKLYDALRALGGA